MKLKPPKWLPGLSRTVYTYLRKAKNGYPKIAPYVGGISTALCGITAWRGGAKCEQILAKEGLLSASDVAREAAAPVIFGGISIASSFITRQITKEQIAGLVTSNVLMANRLKTYTEVDEQGMAIMDDAVSAYEYKKAIREDNIIVLDPDGELYYDTYTHLYFKQSDKKITEALYKLNRNLQFTSFASLQQLYKDYGFKSEMIPSSWKEVGWEYNSVLNELGVPFLDVIIDNYLYPYNEKTKTIEVVPDGYKVIDYRMDPLEPADFMCDETEYATKFWYM